MRRARFLQTGYLALDPKAFGAEFTTQSGETKPFEERGQLAIVTISGPMTQHPVKLVDPFMGGEVVLWDSYDAIEGRARAAFASGARKVGVCMNSPGGSAAGCIELSRSLRALSVETGKPLAFFVDGACCSAAMAIAVSATAGIWSLPTSQVGNIGVYECLVDQTGLDAALGLKYLFVPSTGADLKLEGNPHIPVTEAVAGHVQQKVDILTDLFDGLVEDMRGIPRAELRAMRGASFVAVQAVERKLVDGLKAYPAFLADLEKGTAPMPPKAVTSASTAKASKKMSDEEWSALRTLAESDDEDNRKMAKKMLGSALDDGEGDGEKKEKDGEGKEADGKAKAEKEGEEASAKAAAAAGAGPQAVAATPEALAMAERLHALETRELGREEHAKRVELLAKRPDFAKDVRETLMAAPMAMVERAVTTWPRVATSPMASANAETPTMVPGEKDGAQSPLSAIEKSLLDRIGRDKGPSSLRAEMQGSSLVLAPMSPEAAAARIAEMQKNGTAPRGKIDFERVSNSEFKTAAR